MAILVDTNVLLRSVQPHHPQNGEALGALRILGLGTERLSVVPQVIVEFWTVATRPVANNGLGFTPAQTRTEVDKILATFELLPETPDIFKEWLTLVEQYAVSGVETHDARVVSAMKVHGVKRILTFNEEDFRRYQEITVHTPSNVLTGSLG